MTQASLTTRPAIVSVCGDETARVIEEQLRQRYSSDYEIKGFGVGDALDPAIIERAALILVDAMADGAVELLASVKETHPDTRRLAIAPWGQAIVSDTLQYLMRAGLVDYFAIVPQIVPDEQFHRTVSELLEEWSRENSTYFEFVRMIDDGSSRGHHLRDLLQRNDVPHGVYASSSKIGSKLLEEKRLSTDDLPVFELYDGRVLVDPDVRHLADAITGQSNEVSSTVDVVIVGAGPSGLAAAVYAASEGLSVAVLEREAIGGQAGTTSMIRNYLGFARGITGQQLASRAFRQAWSFGASVRFIREATALSLTPEGFRLNVSDGTVLFGRCVVLAQGIAYRRLEITELEALVGAGVYYGAAVTEAPSYRDKDVVVVGGGNSAGQAALHLSKFATHVTVLVRGPSVATSMSEYLVTEMERKPNISIETGCQVVDGGGKSSLEWIDIEEIASGVRRRATAHGLFVLIGAVPATDWLPDEIAKDDWGFILTERDVEDAGKWSLGRSAFPFETSFPGVFAVGDVRHGSVKRVASAAGEGSVAIQSVHRFLSAYNE